MPYLSRVLGPAGWGLFAIAQAFAMYGGLVVEYGFVYYGTRQIAIAQSSDAIAEIIAGVSGARLLLSALVIVAVALSSFFVPAFRAHPLLFWLAVAAELTRAALPSYYFYGVNRVAIASLLDIAARLAAAAGLFLVVHTPRDVPRIFALQIAGAATASLIGHWMIFARQPFRALRLQPAWRMLKASGNMFLFRSAHNLYSLGNAFILSLFAAPQVVGYYAGAEKINGAAVGLLSPLSTALYPRAAGLVESSLPKAARLTTFCLYLMGAIAIALAALMWFGSSSLVRLILGPQFAASASTLKVLSLRAPMVAWTNVLGFQWLLALGLEKSFQRVTLVALAANLLLATCFAPRFGSVGMACAVVLSQIVAAGGIYLVLRRRQLLPFHLKAASAHA